jgi:steroid delta-isomerase-like uncharacterized protein
MVEENKQLVLSCWEAANGHDVSALDRFYADDAVYYGTDGEVRGRENIKEYLQRFMTASPDLKFSVDDIFAEGDRVFSRVRLQGTNTGPLGDMPPTGKRFDLRWLMNAVRIDQGQIVEEWEICDQLEIMRQLGAIPALAGATSA